MSSYLDIKIKILFKMFINFKDTWEDVAHVQQTENRIEYIEKQYSLASI